MLNNEHDNNSDDIVNRTENEDFEGTDHSPSLLEGDDEPTYQRQTIIPTRDPATSTNHNHTDETSGEFLSRTIRRSCRSLEKSPSENDDEQPALASSHVTNNLPSPRDTEGEECKRSMVQCGARLTLPTDILDNFQMIEAQKQIDSLREHLNETKGNRSPETRPSTELSSFSLLERLVTMEDTYRSEEERHRSLTSEYDLMRSELVQLKQRSTKEKNENDQLLEEQQVELKQLSKSIVSKQSEHDQLLGVYLCFFLSCYLLIFFLFFCLLSW